MKVKSIIAMLLIAMLVFVGCSSDNPKTPPTNSGEGDTNIKESMVQTTSTGKFVVETTIQGLSGQINEVLSSGKAITIDETNPIRVGDVVINKGTISIESTRSISNKVLNIDIERARNEVSNAVIKITHKSNVEMADGEISKIEPVGTTAEIDGSKVSDIEEKTFVPVALAFSNSTLLEKLGEMVKSVAVIFGDEMTMTEFTIDTKLPVIGEITVNAKQSALLPNGSGVLVFKLSIDNQWHTLSSVGGKITLDGWAEVDSEQGKIDVSDTPLVKDDSARGLTDEYIIEKLAPRLYAYYFCSNMLIGDSDSFTEEDFVALNYISADLFGERVSTTSCVFSVSDIDELPFIIEMNAEFTNLPFDEVKMKIVLYNMSNSLDAAAISELKLMINGKEEDYSYLGNDILKSMFRTFSPNNYVLDGAQIINAYEDSSTKTDVTGCTADYTRDGDVVTKAVYTFDNANLKYHQYTYNGNVTINIRKVFGEGTFSFKEVKVVDSDGTTYVISGNGTYKDGGENIEIDYFNLKGIGSATDVELECGAKLIKYMM